MRSRREVDEIVIRLTGDLVPRPDAGDMPLVPGTTREIYRDGTKLVAEYTGNYFSTRIVRGDSTIRDGIAVWRLSAAAMTLPGVLDQHKLESDRYALSALYEGTPVFITTKRRM